MTVAQSIPADKLADAIERIGVRWVVSVPDTHQRTLLAEIEQRESLRLLTCCSEDEGVAIASGLYLGGQEAVLMIQHAGLYASVNNLRGIGLDAKIPLFMMIGLLNREPELPPRESKRSMVRLSEPLLDTLGIPYRLLEGPDDVSDLEFVYRLSRERQGPAAALIGRETV
jgi:sulfopyruvate decarboxylase TPP-binding subunit